MGNELAQAHLCESEDFVGNEFEARAVDFPGTVRVAAIKLLPDGVLYPQVDVPLPIPLLCGRRYICDRALVHLPHLPLANVAVRLGPLSPQQAGQEVIVAERKLPPEGSCGGMGP